MKNERNFPCKKCIYSEPYATELILCKRFNSIHPKDWEDCRSEDKDLKHEK